MHVRSWCLIRKSFYNFSSLEFLKGYNEGEDLHFLFYLIETIISKESDQLFFKRENGHPPPRLGEVHTSLPRGQAPHTNSKKQSCVESWCNIKIECLQLHEKAIKITLPLSTICLCEARRSSTTYQNNIQLIFQHLGGRGTTLCAVENLNITLQSVASRDLTNHRSCSIIVHIQ